MGLHGGDLGMSGKWIGDMSRWEYMELRGEVMRCEVRSQGVGNTSIEAYNVQREHLGTRRWKGRRWEG
jgi:hypothetical protein